jgi:hypothetical protein
VRDDPDVGVAAPDEKIDRAQLLRDRLDLIALTHVLLMQDLPCSQKEGGRVFDLETGTLGLGLADRGQSLRVNGDPSFLGYPVITQLAETGLAPPKAKAFRL